MNERRTVVVLLSVIAVLLLLNLMRPAGGDAHAGGVGDGDPHVVKYLGMSTDLYIRLWSDGQVDAIRNVGGTCEWTFDALYYSPVDHPFEVVDGNMSSYGLIVEFADGRIDFLLMGGAGDLRCTIAGEGSDPFCLGDTDRSGVTDFADLINVLSNWGECVE